MTPAQKAIARVLNTYPATKRKIAMESGLNATTVQKRLAHLQEEGKVYPLGMCGRSIIWALRGN